MHPAYAHVGGKARYKVLEKKIGDTPLQALEELRRKNDWLQSVPLTYAGRLDPMAEGKLLILIGDECKVRERYDGLDKEYEFEVLLGFSSDTGDVLGMAEASGESYIEHSKKELEHVLKPRPACNACLRATTHSSHPLCTCSTFRIPTRCLACGNMHLGSDTPVFRHTLEKIARSFVGTHELNYPAFSSKTINGKPLFQHALEGTLPHNTPTTKVHIYRMKYLGKESVERGELIERIVKKINTLQAPADSGKIGADFRKNEIVERWHSFKNAQEKGCTLLRFKAVVSSGTYIRVLAPLIAERLGTSGLAYSIRRTEIGRYRSVFSSLGFWSRIFK
ncbi:MAG: hypothetical protein V4449_02535 [Patescibacteria group bacterium]